MRRPSRHSVWRSSEVLAYTESEGPGRPPKGPSALTLAALAMILGATFVGAITSTGICEEHRVLVEILAGAAIFGVAAALLALWREWAAGPFITFISSVAGISIGIIDAV